MNRRERRLIFLLAVLIGAAVICRFVGNAGYFNPIAGLVRSGIYIGIFTAWGVSLHRRVVQVRARSYLVAIAALMVLWLLLRTVRFHIDGYPDSTRYLWYLYYLPILFIPLLAALTSACLGKSERYRLPRWTAALYLAAAALVVLILTNDLHQMAFRFPLGVEHWHDAAYSYSIGYWAAVAWSLGCGAAALYLMVHNCRSPRNLRFVWPPLLIMVGYGVLYSLRVPFLRFFVGDVTVVNCLLIAAALEGCIRCGLIQSNTHYGELFNASAIGAQITDRAYQVRLSSRAAQQVPSVLLQKTEDGPVMLDGGVRLSGAPIRGGHVIWQDDVSEVNRLLEELGSVKTQLEGSNDLLAEENKLKEEKTRIDTQNRLYDRVTKEVAPQIGQLNALVADDAGDLRQRLGRICILGAYIKRRCNLILFSEDKAEIPAEELSYCVMESVNNMESAGIGCSFTDRCRGMLQTETAVLAYDLFEAAVEQTLPTLTFAVIRLSAENGAVTLRLMLACEGCAAAVRGLPQIRNIIEQGGSCVVTETDGELQLSVSLPEGGGAA